MAEVDKEVAEMEARLSERKKVLQDLRIGQIPDLMNELRLSTIRLDNGAEISIKRKVSCKFKAEVRDQALDWLDGEGFSDIIRREVAVGFEKGQEETANKAVKLLEASGFHPSVLKDVHHSTLAAWARRQVDAGVTIPGDLFDTNFFNYAEVKHG
jgi:hypothetical protein